MINEENSKMAAMEGDERGGTDTLKLGFSFFLKKRRSERRGTGWRERRRGDGENEAFYHFQLVPGAVAMAWRPAVFSSAHRL